MRWTLGLQGAPKRVNHAAASVGDAVYSFGGYCTGEDYHYKRPIDVHRLNTNNLEWKLIEYTDDSGGNSVPFQRYGHTVVSAGEEIILWGGRNDEGACNIVYVFNVNTKEWRKPAVTGCMPRSRDGHSATVVGSAMFIFGGFEDDTERFSNDVFRLDLKSWNWAPIAAKDAPKWRDFHSASCIGERIYVFGGRSDAQGQYHSRQEEYDNILVYFDVSTSTWNKVEPSGSVLPVGRRSHSSFVYNDKLYIFGGYNGNTDKHFNDIYVFDPSTNYWTIADVKGESRPCPRRRQSCCLVDDKLYLFGGTSPIEGQQHSRAFFYPHADTRLKDQSDLYVLDFSPSLRTLCLFAVTEYDLDSKCLPKSIQTELELIKTPELTQRIAPSSG